MSSRDKGGVHAKHTFHRLVPAAKHFRWRDRQRTISARRKRAASAFRDGILIIHAVSQLDLAADGYQQDPYFYYLTGLENTVGRCWR